MATWKKIYKAALSQNICLTLQMSWMDPDALDGQDPSLPYNIADAQTKSGDCEKVQYLASTKFFWQTNGQVWKREELGLFDISMELRLNIEKKIFKGAFLFAWFICIIALFFCIILIFMCILKCISGYFYLHKMCSSIN